MAVILDSSGQSVRQQPANDILAPEEETVLDWTQRPADLLQTISSVFEDARNCSPTSWYYSGEPTYKLCGVDEHRLMKKIIRDASSERKDFYVLDIGGGDFSWSRALAKFLDEQDDLRDDIQVHIIGIRAETDETPEIEQTLRCKVHNLGVFKIEEIAEQFRQRGLDLQNKVDLAVTRMSFRHLVDPVGTFQQTYHLLRPKTGFLMMDGFVFALEGQDHFEEIYGPTPTENMNMTQLFLDTKAPFLTLFCGHHLNRFILRRPDAAPCRLPMRYTQRVRHAEFKEVACGLVSEYQRKTQPEDQPFYHPTKGVISGDKAMYEWLKQNRLFSMASLKWLWLQDKDKIQETPPLHQAICDGNQEAFDRLLETSDINESDCSGNTPLHYAIGKKNNDLFQALMNKGADFELCKGNGETPLHFAARFDREGLFLSRLIQAGADINRQAHPDSVFIGVTPLDKAIGRGNLRAAEILIRAGAQISEKTNEELAVFVEPLLQEGRISLSQLDDAKNRLPGEYMNLDP